jgi:glycosyl hydrolase family 26
VHPARQEIPSRLRGAATGLTVVAIVASGIIFGRSIGTTIEAEVGAVVPKRRAVPAGRVLAPRTGFYWGAYRDNAPYDHALVTGLDVDAGSRPALVMWYHEWHASSSFPAAEAAWLAARGSVPVVSWEPWRPPAVFGDLVVSQRRYSLAQITAGVFDSYITRYAKEVRAYGGPLMLRPFHEMDGNWYPWGGLVNENEPADFVPAWRHVHDLFLRAGATNVTWVWSVNHVSVPNTEANAISNYWPGASYVDWIGISGFNWGRASPLSVWKGIDAVIGDRYRELLRYRKPIALMETGAPEIGGNKAAWIRDTYRRLLTEYDGIDAVIWYDRKDSTFRDWRIGSSDAAEAAFRRAVNQPGVRAADTATLTTSARPTSAPRATGVTPGD